MARLAEQPSAPDSGAAPADESHYDRLWRAMRILKDFSVSDLRAALSSGVVPSESYTTRYL